MALTLTASVQSGGGGGILILLPSGPFAVLFVQRLQCTQRCFTEFHKQNMTGLCPKELAVPIQREGGQQRERRGFRPA